MLASDLKENALVLGLVKTWENYMWNSWNTQNSFWSQCSGENILFLVVFMSQIRRNFGWRLCLFRSSLQTVHRTTVPETFEHLLDIDIIQLTWLPFIMLLIKLKEPVSLDIQLFSPIEIFALWVWSKPPCLVFFLYISTMQGYKCT